MSSKEKDDQAAADFMTECREQFQQDRDRDQIDRTEAQDDHTFVYSSDLTARTSDGAGSQWSTVAFAARKSLNRPIQQWNRMHIYQQYVVNQARQNDFTTRISPSDKGTPETAEYFEQRIRQIEYENNAGTVYDIARDNQCSSGRGFYRISTEYVPGTFKQRIKLDEIPDQFSVLFGPGKEYDRSDSERCWVILPPMSKAQYKRKWGQKALDHASTFATEYDLTGWWDVGKSGDMVQVCEKFQKEFYKCKLYMLADTVSSVEAVDLESDEFYLDPEDGKKKLSVADGMAAGFFRLDKNGQPESRIEEKFEVWRYTLDGTQVLDKEQFSIDEIPIIPQWGLCAVVLGIQRQYSLGNRAKDAQRDVNLAVSNLFETLGKQNKAKFKAEVGQIATNHMNDWAGITDASILFYSRYENGLDLGIPQEVVSEPPIQACILALQQALEALKAAHGIYDASLGARSNETSARAIDSRKEQAEVVNYHFLGNEARSRKRGGQIMIKLISLLDAPGTTQMLRDQSGKTRNVTVGEEYTHPKSGKQVKHVLNDVDYGLVVDMGPSYKSAMEQVHQTDMQLLDSNIAPEMKLALMPEIMRTQDAPNAEERAEIAENVVNKLLPDVLPQDPEEQEQQIPPAVQQHVAQLEQKLQQTEAFAKSLHEKIETDKVKRQTDVILKDKELAFKYKELEVKSHLELAKLGSADDRALMEAELAQLDGAAGRKHEAALAITGQANDAAESEAARAHQSTEAEAARAAQSSEAQAGRDHASSEAEAAREAEMAVAE